MRIVPGNRLLIWTCVLLPFTVVAPTIPAAAPLAVGLIGILVIAAALDVVMGRSRTAAVDVELPRVVRLTKDRPGSIAVKVSSKDAAVRAISVGLPFEAAVGAKADELRIRLPADASPAAVAEWAVEPRGRGVFLIREAYLQVSSPLGLWYLRASRPVNCEIRVYPNLLQERNRLAGLFLNRGNFGVHTQRQLGQGRDFEKLREYIPGDSYEDIHWKATAKRGRPVTKLYQIERTQEIYVVIDHSRLSARAAGEEPLLDRYLNAALVLGLVAQQQGDLFGLITFSDHVTRFVRAAGGKSHYDRCRDALYTLQPEIVTPDYEEWATFARLRLRRRALMLVLTDLSDPILAESFLNSVQLVNRRHLLLATMTPGADIAPVFSGPKISSIQEMSARLGGHLVWHKLRELEKALRHRGIGLNLASNEKLTTELVSQYMNVKKRQAI